MMLVLDVIPLSAAGGPVLAAVSTLHAAQDGLGQAPGSPDEPPRNFLREPLRVAQELVGEEPVLILLADVLAPAQVSLLRDVQVPAQVSLLRDVRVPARVSLLPDVRVLDAAEALFVRYRRSDTKFPER